MGGSFPTGPIRHTNQGETRHVAQATSHLDRRGGAAGPRRRRLRRRRHQDRHGRDGAAPGGTGTTTGSGSSGETVKIIASVPPTDHGWLGAISKNAKAAADQYADVEFELLEAADADSQAQQIEQAIAEKPDALVVLPQDGAALTPVAQKAERAGIPVVNIDRLFTHPGRRDGDDPRRQLPDRRARGRLHRRRAQVRGQRRRDPGPRGHLGHRGPHQGLRRRAQGRCPDGGIKIVAQQPGDFNPDTGLKVMENILQAAERDRRRVHARRRHGPGRRPGDPQRRPRGRDVPHRRRRLAGRDEADQGGRPVPRDVPLQPEHGRHRGQHGAADRPRRGLPELVPPEVPRQIIVPAAVVTQDNVADYEQYAFN